MYAPKIYEAIVKGEAAASLEFPKASTF